MTSHSRLAKNLLGQQEKKLTVDVPAEVHRRVKSIASREGVNMKDIILEAVYEYIFPKYDDKENK